MLYIRVPVLHIVLLLTNDAEPYTRPRNAITRLSLLLYHVYLASGTAVLRSISGSRLSPESRLGSSSTRRSISRACASPPEGSWPRPLLLPLTPTPGTPSSATL